MFKKIRIRFFLWIKRLLGIIRPPVIIPYRGFGSQQIIYLFGQVLENRPDFIANATDKRWKNSRNMLSRYMSTSIPEQQVTIEFRGKQTEVITDELGFFSTQIILNEPTESTGWQDAEYSINSNNKITHKTTGEVLIVDSKSTYGVISDIDDTVLISHATQVIRKLRLILTKNAKTRLPFPGVREFYQKLAGNDKINPIFYVSSSEWNLYDFLVDFFATQELPKGPFLLQKFKSGLLDLIHSGGGSHDHKREKIEEIFERFAHLKFVLIGDNGQRDPEIYSEIVRRFPNRVLAIYIRDIKEEKVNSEIKKPIQDNSVPLLLMKNTSEAQKHAYKLGLI